jgi:preprotein translocase subunit SecE
VTTLKSKTGEERSPLDTAKLVVAFLLAAAGIALFYWFDDAPQYYRIPGLLVVVGVAAALVVATAAGRSLLGFARDARTELRKVVWPTRQETVQTTLVVLVMVFIVGIFLWLLDMFFLWAVNRLMGLGG